MGLEDRLAAMEERLAALEKENQELRQASEPPVDDLKGRRDPESIRKIIERDLTPYQRMQIRALAIDVQRYGYDNAMVAHGRALPKRGRKNGH